MRVPGAVYWAGLSDDIFENVSRFAGYSAEIKSVFVNDEVHYKKCETHQKMAGQVHFLRIFADGEHGGNPLPVVVEAAGMTDAEMQAVASSYGHESGFVFPGPLNYDFEFRFWVPEHEMEMCGHATVGAVWMLAKIGALSKDKLRILTKSGVVEANVTQRMGGIWVEVSQEQGVVDELKDIDNIYEDICTVLGITRDDLAPGIPIQNSKTSRVKTAIPMISKTVLNTLQPQFHKVKELCERIGSTGLYPYAIVDIESQVFDARQFPKSSGYSEDAATGIAASALSFALLENDMVGTSSEITIRQGRAMGSPSKIITRFRKEENTYRINGCWIGGTAMLKEDSE